MTGSVLVNLSNGYDMFYSLNIPSNFLGKGFVEMELEFPAQISTSINYLGISYLILFISL